MPDPICPRKDSEQGLILRGIKCQTAPSSHMRKINSRLGILIILPSQLQHVKNLPKMVLHPAPKSCLKSIATGYNCMKFITFYLKTV